MWLFPWKVVYHYPLLKTPKYADWYVSKVTYELYNLKKDPYETKNLADTHSTNNLKTMLLALQKEMNEKGALYPEKQGKSLQITMPKIGK